MLTMHDIEALQSIRVKATDEQLSKVMEIFSMEITRRNRQKCLTR